MMLGNLLICGITLVLFVAALSGEVKEEGQCEPFAVMICGDSRSRFRLRFCQPDVEGLKSILSVHLDTRYDTRYCKQQTFGISKDKKEIWVSNFCYGTFFVCLELDTGPPWPKSKPVSSGNADTQEGVTNTTSDEASTTLETNAQKEDQDAKIANKTADASSNLDQIDGETDTIPNDGVTEPAVHSPDKTKRTGQSSSPLVKATEPRTDRDTPPSITQTPRHFNAERGSKMDPTMKTLLMAGIGTGGLVLILLICVTAYLIHTCKSKRKKQSSQSGAFKSQKLSTSALVSAEYLNDASVYESIPCDRTNSNTLNSSMYLQKTQPSEKLEKPAIANKPVKHEYFTLAPEVCKFCAPTIHKHNTGVYNHTQDEGVYDHLVSVPRTSVSDSSTYHHLWTFSRERKMTEDMSTQTDLSELESGEM